VTEKPGQRSARRRPSPTEPTQYDKSRQLGEPLAGRPSEHTLDSRGKYTDAANAPIAWRLKSDKSASISRLRGIIRSRRSNQSSIVRIMLRQRRRRIILRDLQKGAHPHLALERPHRCQTTHIPLDRKPLQPPPATLHLNHLTPHEYELEYRQLTELAA
jgi:hypothetical protein